MKSRKFEKTFPLSSRTLKGIHDAFKSRCVIKATGARDTCHGDTRKEMKILEEDRTDSCLLVTARF